MEWVRAKVGEFMRISSIMNDIEIRLCLGRLMYYLHDNGGMTFVSDGV